MNFSNRTLAVQRTLVGLPQQAPFLKDIPKTEVGFRTVLLTTDLVPLLEMHRIRQEKERQKAGEKWTDRGMVFTRIDGRPMSCNTVEKSFARARDGFGIPKHRFHALRRTFASIALQGRVGMAEISAMMGHTSVAFTAQTYAHVLDATRRDAAERFDRFVQESERATKEEFWAIFGPKCMERRCIEWSGRKTVERR